MPALLIMEGLLLGLTCVNLLHARRSGGQQLLLWSTTLILGAANDQFFAMLPAADNFFHAQATMMLTHRLPLHVVLQYNVFMYPAVTATSALPGGVFCQAASAALLGAITQMINDVICTKFILYTWHESDISLKHRLMGVAVGNNSFMLCFLFSFVVLLRWSYRLPTVIRSVSMLCIGATTPCAVLLVFLSQLVYKDEDGPIPTYFSYFIILATMTLLAFSPLLGTRTIRTEEECEPKGIERRSLHQHFLLVIGGSRSWCRVDNAHVLGRTRKPSKLRLSRDLFPIESVLRQTNRRFCYGTETQPILLPSD